MHRQHLDDCLFVDFRLEARYTAEGPTVSVRKVKAFFKRKVGSQPDLNT